MTRIAGEVTIDAPVDEVFDLVADERNEPRYNPRIAAAEKVDDGPIGAGTRFVAVPKGMGSRGGMILRVVEYDRPHRLHNVVRSAYMEVEGTLTFEEVPGGTRMTWDWDMGLTGRMRVLTPFLGLFGPRWERRNWVGLKEYVESGRERRTHDFDASYVAGRPPWDIGRPQSAFRELADRGRLAGRVLDVGCGTGEHALMAAALGLDATGLDSASTAVSIARRKAHERGLEARFLIGNALELADLGESFDTVLDCGLFHVFDDSERPRFVGSLRASMPVGGWYYMLCFSDLEPGGWGPRRIRQEEIRTSFSDGWRVAEIAPAALETTIEPGSVRAWLASIQRT